MSEFKREPRYIVLKLKDIEAYLSPVEKEALMVMGVAIHKGRTADGKAPFNAVVVEQDWPEFEPTWEAIEGRMTGTPIEPRYAIRLRIRDQEARVAELEAQNALLVEALEQFQFAYPYEPPCHDWEAKALAHRKAKKALDAVKEMK